MNRWGWALVGLLLLSGCDRMTDHGLDAGVATPGARLVTEPLAQRRLETYRGSGDVELGFLAYRGSGPAADTALVYLHGIESHSVWFDPTADLLAAAGIHVFALDRRGSGVNRENRGLLSGHAQSWEVLMEDVRRFVAPLHERYARVVLAGLSWGGKLATAYALAHPEHLDGLVLITPGLVSRVDISTPAKLRVLLATAAVPTAAVRVPIEAEMFTTTPRFLSFIREDPLRLTYVSARFLMQGVSLDRQIRRRIQDRQVPALLVLAGGDRIIDNGAVLELLGGSDRADLAVLSYPEQTHSVQMDAPERLSKDMLAWMATLARD